MNTFMNADIKAQALLNGVRLYEIAYHCQMSVSTFSRRMCRELSQADREQFLKAIEEIATEKKDTGFSSTTITAPRQVTADYSIGRSE